MDLATDPVELLLYHVGGVHVLDRGSNRIIGVDSLTGAAVRTYQTAAPTPNRPRSLAYARPDGSVLISGLTGSLDVPTDKAAQPHHGPRR